MKQVITEDSSITFYNEKLGEHYHSDSGAKEEAFEKHAKALGVSSIENPVILDVCFGLGYKSAAALDLLKKAKIYCFENDKEILSKILEINADFKSYHLIKEFIRLFLETSQLIYKKDNFELIMVFGDARERIKEIGEKADFVFFDPFSPAKTPEMWTAEFFKDIKSKMKKGAKLSTYSCAGFIRKNMKQAGFEVIDGPSVGRRAAGTIAVS